MSVVVGPPPKLPPGADMGTGLGAYSDLIALPRSDAGVPVAETGAISSAPLSDKTVPRTGRVQLVKTDERSAVPPTERGWTWPVSYRSVQTAAMVIDIAVIVVASVAAGVIYRLFNKAAAAGTTGDPIYYIGLSAVVAALFIAFVKERGLYKPTDLLLWNKQVRATIIIWAGIFLFLAGCVFALKAGTLFSRTAVAMFATLGLFGLVANRTFWRVMLEKGLASGRLPGCNVVLISEGSDVGELVKSLVRCGFRVCRHIAVLGGPTRKRRWPDAVSAAIKQARGANIDEIFIAADLNYLPDVQPALEKLRMLPLPVNFVALGPGADLLTHTSHSIGSNIVLDVQRAPLNLFESTVKRVVDIAVAGTALIALLPLLVLTAIAIRLDTAGPVLFRQTRHGFNGTPFQILKFRTMTVLEDGDLVRQAAKDDDRITRVGAWLRRTSIDELPQLINVLKGDMSIVGPRPHAVSHDNHFDKSIANYSFRHRMRPGLTGLAQVNGCRGETPTLNSMIQRVDYDIQYIENWSIWLDLAIMLRTVGVLLRGHNAY